MNNPGDNHSSRSFARATITACLHSRDRSAISSENATSNWPVVRGGFTQVPNFILKNGDLSLGAKVTYAMFLHYTWHNDSCFPGQERLAEDMGMSQSRVSEFIKELQTAELIEITRRGQGRTNLYKIKFVVRRMSKPKRQIS